MRAGRHDSANAESALNLLTLVQLILFLMPLFMNLNWQSFQEMVSQSEKLQRARNPEFKGLDSGDLYLAMCIMLVAMASLVFLFALFASFATAFP